MSCGLRILCCLTFFLLPLLPMQAQEQKRDQEQESDDAWEASSVYVRVRTSSLGNVNIGISSESEAIRNLIPSSLSCSWVETKRTDYQVVGSCRSWLAPSKSTLRLAPLVAALKNHGAGSVQVSLTTTVEDVPSGWKAEGKSRMSYLSFRSAAGSPDLPGDVLVQVTPPPNLMVPILVVVCLPILVACFVRRSVGGATPDRKMNWLVWMNWIAVSIWLYWISAVNPMHVADLLFALLPVGALTSMILGALLYVAPPMIATAACLLAMAPLMTTSRSGVKRLICRQLMAMASVQVPLAMIFVGTGALRSSESDWAMIFSVVGAYLVYRVLAFVNWRLSYSEVTPLESGALFERASSLARKAGVKLARLGMLRTKTPEEANAFASSGDVIILTESLVCGLTPREVDAIIAHELGHHQAGHLRFDYSFLSLVGYLVAASLIGSLFGYLHFPSWLSMLPVLPVVFVLMEGIFSQKRELTADARAVAITGDAEGKIAALGRLAQLSRMPIHGGGIMASIMSHPSMEDRVLALARRYGVADERALAILRNPDEAYDNSIANLAFAVNPDVPESTSEPVFSQRERVSLIEQMEWLQLLSPLASSFMLGLVLQTIFPMWSFFRHLSLTVVVFSLAVLAMVAMEMLAEILLEKRFASRMRKKITAIAKPPVEARFVGIHPGNGVRYTDGFSEWDFGFATLEDGWLRYRGEKADFAIARHDILSIQLVKGPFRWLRSYRAEVTFRGGVFTLGSDFSFPTRRQAAKVQKWIQDWVSMASAEEPRATAPAPPPLLPKLPGMEIGRIAPLWMSLKTCFKIVIAIPSFHILVAEFLNPFTVILQIFGGPLAVFLSVLPGLLWPIRRVPEPAAEEPQPCPVAEPALHVSSSHDRLLLLNNHSEIADKHNAPSRAKVAGLSVSPTPKQPQSMVRPLL